MDKRGFSLIELLTVVAVVGLLASIATIKSRQTRERAARASMLVDLRTLVSAQEGYLSANGDYAGKLADVEKPSKKAGAGTAAFRASPQNTITLKYHGRDGWSATAKNSTVTNKPKTCGIYIGPAAYSPNKAVIVEGIPSCY
jgi:prepilin-type N-terminal cleavage/methylation domain-containing protein